MNILLVVLFTHFIYGGICQYIAKSTYEAITEFIDTRNYLSTGYISHHNYNYLMRKAISWACISLAYVLGYMCIIYISLTIL